MAPRSSSRTTSKPASAAKAAAKPAPKAKASSKAKPAAKTSKAAKAKAAKVEESESEDDEEEEDDEEGEDEEEDLESEEEAPKAKATKAKAAKATKASSSKAAASTKKTAAKKPESKTEKKAKPAAASKKAAEKKAEEEKPKPTANGAGTKRTRDEPEPADAPAPKKKVEVKRRRNGPQVNALPKAPEPRGLALFVWGTGDMGQFGTGPDDLDEKPRPQIHKWIEEKREDGELGKGTGGIESIAAGGMHTLAVDEAGQTRSWGINDNAALGRDTANQPDPESPNSMLPAEDFETWPLVVDALAADGFRAVKVAAGDSVSVALSGDGELRAWGSFRSNEGILGFDGVPGHAKFQFRPMALAALEKARAEVVDVACGADHVLALTSDGYVFVWGNGQQNQLGRRILARRAAHGLEPERLGLRHIVHVAAGMFHSFAVDRAGDVWAWGLNTYGQTGLDSGEEMVIRPQKVAALSPAAHGGARVVQIAGGDAHSLFLFDNGEVWAVGRQDGNELGLAPDHPAQAGLAARRADIQAEREQKVADAAAALEAAAGEEEKADAQMKLLEAQAALRVPMGEYVPEPVRVAFPPVPEKYEVVPELPAWDAPAANPIARISAGTRHNLAVSRSGHVYAWGLGNQGQLGLGAVEEAATPSLVRSAQLRPYDAVDVSAGGQHCVLIARKRDE